MQSKLLAAAVFFGLVLVAISVYLGLVYGQPGLEPDPRAMTGSPTAVQAETLTQRSTLERAREQARRSMQDNLQPYMLEHCWNKLRAIEPEPSTSTYHLQLAFAKDGRETGRAISQVRETPSRYDVAECLRTLPLGLSIDPLPQFLAFEFELHFGEDSLAINNLMP
ncbi:MAG: hypothetical protein EA418_10385 [Wenzhouxiangellaceae bacterium]|nr:MAG: hypothetical protein EA418_10385 [Wenzhouxiangellaceae bacterium]